VTFDDRTDDDIPGPPPNIWYCERCGLAETAHHIQGGLCLDCQFDDELTEEPALCPPPELRECANCGRESLPPLCRVCDPFVVVTVRR
jgi:hypothetical protein